METKYVSTATTSFNGIKFTQSDIMINCEIPTKGKNWAFIDMQNLYKGIKEKGWKINWKLFRQFLEQKYAVTKAVVFMGYIKENAGLYLCLKNAGFIIEFRKVNCLNNG